MSRRFNMGDAAKILGTNPKTFKNWLKADGIDIENQLNRADSREKYVTDEQVLAIAKKRDIEVRLPEERKAESTSVKILAGMDSRITTLEQKMTGRFDQVDTHLQTLAEIQHQMEQLMAEVQRLRTSAPPQERPPDPAPHASNKAPAISTSTPVTTTPPRLTRPARSKRKSKTRKNLPGTLTPLATFRQLHNVTEKAVENAVQRGRLTVVRGAWLYQHRSITVALDRQGQQQFYALFNEREGFQECKGCSHAL